MPLVTAIPRGQQDGSTVTQFTDTTNTSAVTYTYPTSQSSLIIENSGERVIYVTVGGVTNQQIQVDTKYRYDGSFTSFSVRSDVNSQEFIATSIIAVVSLANNVLTADNNLKYKIVAFVIRNNGANNWEYISDTNHAPVNGGVITTDASDITVNFGWTCKHIGSFVACPDETFAQNGYIFGASVGINAAIIRCSRTAQNLGAYISYNGAGWDVFSPAGNVAVSGFSAGTLTLTHDSIVGYQANVVCRDGGYLPSLGSLGSGTSEIKFYDYAGTLITTPSTGMKVYFSRSAPATQVNPQTLNIAGANIWCYGVFEV